MNDLHVLLVEDDPHGQNVVVTLLEHFTLIVDVASEAETALNMLKERQYAAVIIDLSLPGMSGWELLATIREQHPKTDLPCFAVTAFHSPRVARDAVEAGFTAYFPKPINFQSFVTELEQHIAY